MRQEVKDHVFVFGHQNPDTDSVCTAIAYAYLKKQMGMDAAPYRLGKLNKETLFILESAKIEMPSYLPDIKVKLRDLDLFKARTLKNTDPLSRAWQELVSTREEGARLVPVTGADNKINGLVALEDITKTFMISPTDELAMENEILFKNLLDVVNGTVIAGAYPYKSIKGAFYVGSDEPENLTLTDKDVIITGIIENIEKHLEANDCGCILVANEVDLTVYKNNRDSYKDGPAIVEVNSSIVRIVSTIHQAISVSSVMKTENFVTFTEDVNIGDTIETMRSSSHRNFPVVSGEGEFSGIISRQHLMQRHAKNVILVDHNENRQSAIGIETANILEIIDHHRIADVQTDSPLYIRAEPVGCTATIVTRMFEENQVDIPKDMATIMLGAILSDTLLFTSPTCTPKDELAAKKLAEIADKNIEAFGKAMFKASTSIKDFTNEELLNMDGKKFSFGSLDVYVAQINVMDFTEIRKRQKKIEASMDAYALKFGLDIILFMVTNIEKGGSALFFAGPEEKIARNIFGADLKDTGFFLPGVLSRKKQIIPVLHQAIE